MFYQDFLFEDLPLDSNENPMVEFQKVVNVADYEHVDPQKAFKNNKVAIDFSSLVEMTSEENWKELFQKLQSCISVALIDDMQLKNAELIPYKEFYLKTYFLNLQKYCRQCYLYDKNY